MGYILFPGPQAFTQLWGWGLPQFGNGEDGTFAFSWQSQASLSWGSRAEQGEPQSEWHCGDIHGVTTGRNHCFWSERWAAHSGR